MYPKGRCIDCLQNESMLPDVSSVCVAVEVEWAVCRLSEWDWQKRWAGLCKRLDVWVVAVPPSERLDQQLHFGSSRFSEQKVHGASLAGGLLTLALSIVRELTALFM